ncbi:hypothetical protein BBBOND_0307690 [Babesia bigemina]|uniref:Ribosome binding protein n=1 Tax=Babesia bigemina TaxID=5866 RepID=A0A061DE65_BABBI|nr:hypothetical protein BBBOND_0307690 [Babesia bigemina]CDR96865.1 hypothetical protein BBBOND_0307690 [Babesia bigemina]|eukprot:XP_012769051.1 hypothetical protein BBBOND_0307690 [Babesia bigemina]
MAAKGAAGGTAHGVPLDTLKDCLQFLEWLNGRNGQRSHVVTGIVQELRPYYGSNSQFKGQLQNRYVNFIKNVDSLHKKLSFNVGTTLRPYEVTLRDPKLILDALLECTPKLLAALSFIQYHVDGAFSGVGGGDWASQSPNSGDFRTFLTTGNYILRGGFSDKELSSVQGSTLVEDLKTILNKYGARGHPVHDHFRNVMLITLARPLDPVNTGNAVFLLPVFCELVIGDPDGNKYKSSVEKAIGTNTICWTDLKDHCQLLKEHIDQLTAAGFSATGIAFKPKEPVKFVTKAAEWCKANLSKTASELGKMIPQSIYSRSTELQPFANDKLYPHGFIFDGSKQRVWAKPSKLDEWGPIFQKFIQLDVLLRKLKDILDGYECGAAPLVTNARAVEPTATKTEATKTEAAKPVVTKADATKPVLKNAGSSPNQNNGQSERKPTTSSVVTSSSKHPGGTGAPGSTGAKGEKGPLGHPSTVYTTSFPPQNNVQRQSPAQPPPATPPRAPAGPASPSKPDGGGKGSQGDSAGPQPTSSTSSVQPQSPGVQPPGPQSPGASSNGGGTGLDGKVPISTTQRSGQDTSQTSTTAAGTTSSGSSSGAGGGGGSSQINGAPGSQPDASSEATITQLSSVQSPDSVPSGATGSDSGPDRGVQRSAADPIQQHTQVNPTGTGIVSTASAATDSTSTAVGSGDGAGMGGRGAGNGQPQTTVAIKKNAPACDANFLMNYKSDAEPPCQVISNLRSRTSPPTSYPAFDRAWEKVQENELQRKLDAKRRQQVAQLGRHTPIRHVQRPTGPSSLPSGGHTVNQRPYFVPGGGPSRQVSETLHVDLPSLEVSGDVVDSKPSKEIEDKLRRKLKAEEQVKLWQWQAKKEGDSYDKKLLKSDIYVYGSEVADTGTSVLGDSDVGLKGEFKGTPLPHNSDHLLPKQHAADRYKSYLQHGTISDGYAIRPPKTQRRTVHPLKPPKQYPTAQPTSNKPKSLLNPYDLSGIVLEPNQQGKKNVHGITGQQTKDNNMPLPLSFFMADGKPVAKPPSEKWKPKTVEPNDIYTMLEKDVQGNVLPAIPDILSKPIPDPKRNMRMPKLDNDKRYTAHTGKKDFVQRKSQSQIGYFDDHPGVMIDPGICPASYGNYVLPVGVTIPPTDSFNPPPRTVRQMLCWLSDLPSAPSFAVLTQLVASLFDSSHNIVASETFSDNDVISSMYDACGHASSVLGGIQGSSPADMSKFHFERYGVALMHYSEDPYTLLCQLLSYVYAAYHQLSFLRTQCSRDTHSGGWRDCQYGKNVNFSETWQCTKFPADIVKSHHHGCDPSPLQGFLTDHLDLSTYRYERDNMCRRSHIKMGFQHTDLQSKSMHGFYIYQLLIGACYTSDPLENLCRYLVCLTRRTPRTTGELVSYFHHFGIELHGYASDGLSPLGTALTKSYVDCPDWDHLGRHDLVAVKGIRGSESLISKNNSSHDNAHPRTLSTLVGCSGDPANCHPRISPITYRAYALYSQSFAHTYLSWAVYLPDRLHESLQKLYYELKKHDSSKCSSLHLCSTALPLLYLHGFTPPEGKSQPTVTCSDVITKLQEIVNGRPIADFISAMDNFLYGIREPFIFTIVALWSLAFLIFANTMLYRLDVLRIRSHLIRTKASHHIDVKALLTKGRKMLSLYKDVDYFDEDPIGQLVIR